MTKEAARLAGLECMEIISEPMAAALNYISKKDEPEKNRRIIVFDLGGGTFDVSILEIEQRKINVKCIIGDSSLGGLDFDNAIYNYVIEEYKKKEDALELNEQSKRMILRECKNAKESI